MTDLLDATIVRRPSEIRNEIAVCEREHRKAIDALQELAEVRSDALVDAKDAEVDKIEGRIRSHERARDRSAARVAALQDELQAALAREREERARALVDALRLARQIGDKDVALVFDLAHKMRAALERIAAATELLNKHAAPGSGIVGPNETRRSPVQIIPAHTKKETRRVGAFMGGQRVHVTGSTQTQDGAQWVEEVKVPEQRVGGECPPNVCEQIQLPGFGYRDADIWSDFVHYDVRARYVEIMAAAGVVLPAEEDEKS